jgi:ATP-dependent protease ClpP protease subunit
MALEIKKSFNLFGVVMPKDWGPEVISAQTISDFLNTLEGNEPFTVFINSPGGSVFEGLAIYNLLAEHQSQMTVKIIGEASSIASVIACAASKENRLIAESALELIHKPWNFAIGDEDYYQKVIKELTTIKNSIITVYKRGTGLSENRINELMTEGSYRNAEECVSLGFAGQVYIPSETEQQVIDESTKVAQDMLRKYVVMNMKIKDFNNSFSKETPMKTLEEAISEIGALTVKNENLTTERTSLQSKADKLQHDVTNLTQQLETVKGELSAKVTELNKVTSENITMLAEKAKSQEQLIIALVDTDIAKLADKITPAENSDQNQYKLRKDLIHLASDKEKFVDADGKPLYDVKIAEIQARNSLGYLTQHMPAPQDNVSIEALTADVFDRSNPKHQALIAKEARARAEKNGTSIKDETIKIVQSLTKEG